MTRLGTLIALLLALGGPMEPVLVSGERSYLVLAQVILSFVLVEMLFGATADDIKQPLAPSLSENHWKGASGLRRGQL
jgi:hypothetical protein